LTVLLAAACRSPAPDRSAGDTLGVQALARAQVDVSHLLDVGAYLSGDYIAKHGTCLPTGDARSRTLYALLPSDASYLRLSVYAPANRSIEMVDLVRGVSDGRIWTATFKSSASVVTARTFASNNDPAPAIEQWSPDDPRSQRLRSLAAIAMEPTCRDGVVNSQ
jgi:hypothetical protein